MAKKQYYELYQEIKSLKPKTQAYYKAVSRLFHLTIDKDGKICKIHWQNLVFNR